MDESEKTIRVVGVTFLVGITILLMGAVSCEKQALLVRERAAQACLNAGGSWVADAGDMMCLRLETGPSAKLPFPEGGF